MYCGRPGFDPWVGKIPWRGERLPTPVFQPGESHGLYSLWGWKESDLNYSLLVCWGEIGQSQEQLCGVKIRCLGCCLRGSCSRFRLFATPWCRLSLVAQWTSHCGGFSYRGAQALGCLGFSNCDFQALKHGLNSYGIQTQLPHDVWDVPGYITRQILDSCTTREALPPNSDFDFRFPPVPAECAGGGGGAVKIIFPKELLYRHDIPFSFDLAGSHSKLSVSA